MKLKSPFHHAFRITYAGLVNVLISDCHVSTPSVINPDSNKPFVAFKAIWDTGATNSVITENVVKKLALLPTGKTQSSGVHGKQIVNTYIVDIGLPNKICVGNVRVSEGKLMGNVDILIGMDIIQMGDFSISNPNGKTLFSFCIPSHKNPVDLLEKSNCVNPKTRFSISPPPPV